MQRQYDHRTGRPLEDGQEALRTLTDDELAIELLIAAAAPGRMRVERLDQLRAERLRRRFQTRFPAGVR